MWCLPIGARVSSMTETHQRPCVHVRPDDRGDWTVQSDQSDTAASVHGDASAAARSAGRYARTCGAELVVVHDRYTNLHVTIVGA
jgi:hypothetical protein